MPAASSSAVGVKLVGLGHSNASRGLASISSVYVLFDADTIRPIAIVDGTRLTEIRTAAQSAMVVRCLAQPDASRLVVFGAGPQALAHARAIASVRPIVDIAIVARRVEAVNSACQRLQREGLDARPATDTDVARAQVVVCATSAQQPILFGRDLAEGVLVVAVGSHTAGAREVDDDAMARADLIVVEDRDTAMREAGDVIQAVTSGVVSLERIRDFSDLVGGTLRPSSGITVYKSVGMGYQDLAVVEMGLRDVIQNAALESAGTGQ